MVALAPYFTTGSRLRHVWQLGRSRFILTRPNRFRLRYGSRVRLARLRVTDCSAPRGLGYLLNGQLQGRLLSAYKISQAFPGVPGQRYACYSPACGRSRGQDCTDRAYPLIRVVLHSRVTLPKPADCEAAVIGVALT